MSKKIWILSFLLVFGLFICSVTSIHAQMTESDIDTFIVSTIESFPPDSGMWVEVILKSGRDINSFTFPMTFRSAEGDTALDIDCDSFRWPDWFTTYTPFLFTAETDSFVDNTEKSLTIYAAWGYGGADSLPAGEWVLCSLHFTSGTYWDSLVPAKLDTYNIFLPTTELQITEPGPVQYKPQFKEGYLGKMGSWVREIDVENSYIPERFALNQNYPNPFNPNTVIRFALPEDSWVKIEVFNILGQKITTLVDEHLTAGHKETGWNGTDSRGNNVASGIYFYKINAKNFTDIKKMVLLK